LANKLRAAREELTKEFSRSPTVNEVADYLDITPEEAAQAQEATKYPHSIYETVYENGGEPITLLDQLQDTNKEWFNKILLDEAINHLSQREKIIINMRYFRDQTQSEVAYRLGISQVQVSQLEKKILAEMKQLLHQYSINYYPCVQFKRRGFVYLLYDFCILRLIHWKRVMAMDKKVNYVRLKRKTTVPNNAIIRVSDIAYLSGADSMLIKQLKSVVIYRVTQADHDYAVIDSIQLIDVLYNAFPTIQWEL